MRAIFCVLFFFILTAINAQTKKAVIQTTLYCNHCKVCETCGKKFDTELLKVKGLKMYELNEEEQTLTVYFNSKKTSLDIIKKKITSLGFDADEMKALPEAYESLDACCKKE